MSNHQCHKQNKTNTTWLKIGMNEGVCPRGDGAGGSSFSSHWPNFLLSFPLILCCVGSLDTYLQTKQGHQGMWCQARVPVLLIPFPLHDRLTHLPWSKLTSWNLRLETLVLSATGRSNVFLRNRPCIIIHARSLS